MIRVWLPLHTLLSLSLVACASTDADGDKYPASEDCDDSDPAINPGAPELCGDLIDNNCDGILSVNCADDMDADGFLAADDCNDNDPDIFPGASENCLDNIDNNCDGVVTECIAPTMIYDHSSESVEAPYSTAIFADRVVFGEPNGDGTANIFNVQAARVDTSNAVATIAGEPGSVGALGVSFTRAASFLCVGAEYFDGNAVRDSGKTYCFDAATIGTNGPIDPSASVFDVIGDVEDSFSHVLAITDVDGDALDDLVVYTARGVRIISGDGSPWSGQYNLAFLPAVALGNCTAADPIWCGYGRAALLEDPQALIIAGDGPDPTVLSWYDLPLTSSPPAPDATLSVPRAQENASSSVAPLSGFAVGNTDDQAVTLLDGSRTPSTLQGNGPAFGHWVTEGVDLDDHRLLAVSDPFQSTGLAQGLVYIFDLDLTPTPTDVSQARYILTPPEGFIDCGWRTDIGTVTDPWIGSRTTVSSTCLSSGGAVYELDLVAPQAPPPPPGSITQTGARRFDIEQGVVDTYTSRIEWIQQLAQPTMEVEGGEIIGWRLGGVAPESAVDQIGLRDGDIVQKVNGRKLTTRGVVRDVALELRNDTFFVVDILRNGNAKRYRYSIVP